VAGIRCRQRLHGASPETLPVSRGERTAPRRPGGKAGETRSQNRGLHLVEPRVEARLLVMIAIGLTAIAKAFDRRGQRRVVRDDRPAVAEGTEVLGRVE